MTWEEAWEQDKYDVGRAMHEGWKRQKIANGFANHSLKPPLYMEGPDMSRCARCGKPPEQHHDDMIPWEDLPLHQQAINYEGGIEGYRMGYERGHLQGEIDEHGNCPEHGYVSCLPQK